MGDQLGWITLPFEGHTILIRFATIKGLICNNKFDLRRKYNEHVNRK